ncbi:MAG TPA: hypothetical protein VGG14_17780 [Candidatus Sulfotelmatobacter sp.]|jgi:hypothetical protein
MDVLTPKAMRRGTRLRVEIPLTLTSMDRRHPLSAECVALLVNPQGCGVRASQALPLETPVFLGDLPGGATASGRVASCLPLGNDGRFFLIGVSLYNPGNVWGIANPPEDWNCSPAAKPSAENSNKKKEVWPYNLDPSRGKPHSYRK